MDSQYAVNGSLHNINSTTNKLKPCGYVSADKFLETIGVGIEELADVSSFFLLDYIFCTDVL